MWVPPNPRCIYKVYTPISKRVLKKSIFALSLCGKGQWQFPIPCIFKHLRRSEMAIVLRLVTEIAFSNTL